MKNALVAFVGAIGLASVAGAHEDTATAARHAWPFEEILSAPTAPEIARAGRSWHGKTVRISDVERVGRTEVALPNVTYATHLLEYVFNGSKRCGAVLIPGGSVSTTLVDLSDISWDYPPRDISGGPFAAKILAERAPEAALVIPCFRGMTLSVNDISVTAEGDRRDAWEGATEDAMAFVTVALEAFPRLPREQVVAYGYSRGGGVALLLGQRDSRVKRVAAFAGPTDFFSAMRRPGTDWPSALRAASGDPDFPRDSRERQYLDWFFSGLESCSPADIRHKMLMSSPAYFLRRLPPTQIHQGKSDRPVPVANAELVAEWARRHGRTDIDVFVYEGQGHQIDDPEAFRRAREFLLAS